MLSPCLQDLGRVLPTQGQQVHKPERIETLSKWLTHRLLPHPIAGHEVLVFTFISVEDLLWCEVHAVGEVGVANLSMENAAGTSEPDSVLAKHPRRYLVVRTRPCVRDLELLPCDVAKRDSVDAFVQVPGICERRVLPGWQRRSPELHKLVDVTRGHLLFCEQKISKLKLRP